jgi:uncharacterized protein DUF4190
MVVGIVSLVVGLCGCLGLMGLVAVVLGLLARRDIAAAPGYLTGSGKATTGIVTGALGAGMAMAWLVFLAIQLAQGEDVTDRLGT